MVLWIGFAILAAAVVWAVTRPLMAARASAPSPDTALAVYKDQLAEIEAERAQGLIAGTEAEGARVEVARRLIRRAEEGESAVPADAGGDTSLRSAVLWSAAALPIVALVIYLGVGSPSLPGRPYAARLNTPLEQATAADLVAKVEAHLRQHPDDGRGWDVLAPVYMRMGEFQQAVDAFERATRLLGESPQRLAGFARASIMLEQRRRRRARAPGLQEAAHARAESAGAAGVAGHRQGAGRRSCRCGGRLQGADGGGRARGSLAQHARTAHQQPQRQARRYTGRRRSAPDCKARARPTSTL